MKAKLRRQTQERKRKLARRIDQREGVFRTPMIRPVAAKYELAEKQQAVACGGIGMVLQVVKQLGLRKLINTRVPIFKMRLPYDETDHILNIVLNLMSGGTRLEHLEQRRNDEAYLDAVGAERIPDPTTAGDFCRRFNWQQILMLQQAINVARQSVWKQQPADFFAQATIEADGSMVETYGEKKQGIGMNYKGQWGYHPLVVTLAETQEVLYLANRSGNRPSHESSHLYFDLAIQQCQQAGFRKIVLRGDTDFSLTDHLDRWHAQGVLFVLGFDANKTLTNLADSLPKSAWKPLSREKAVSPDSRAKRPNYKEAFVVAKEYENQILRRESYAEFDYRPAKCKRAYRVVVVRKEIDVHSGQRLLFDKERLFFYISNESKDKISARDIIRAGNRRCNQENTISQLKACSALHAPLDSLESNWAYMTIASLAWTLKTWTGMLIRIKGNPHQRRKRELLRRRIIAMEFGTYLNSLMLIPAQVIRSARQLTLRLLTYRPSVDLLLTAMDHVQMPLRC